MALNYGLNRVRFVSPVPSGSRIRARVALAKIDDMADSIQATWTSPSSATAATSRPSSPSGSSATIQARPQCDHPRHQARSRRRRARLAAAGGVAARTAARVGPAGTRRSRAHAGRAVPWRALEPDVSGALRRRRSSSSGGRRSARSPRPRTTWPASIAGSRPSIPSFRWRRACMPCARIRRSSARCST